MPCGPWDFGLAKESWRSENRQVLAEPEGWSYEGLANAASQFRNHLICRRQALAALLPNSGPTRSLVLGYPVVDSTDVQHPRGRSNEFSLDSCDTAFRAIVWPVLADLE